MTPTRNILEDEALDFVFKGKQVSSSPGQDELVATIRGDLEHVNLPDIFQTLTMSQMVGTLRIQSGWDPTYVHFADGKIRVLPPEDVFARRLGHRLLSSGLMESKDIRAAFLKHKKSGLDILMAIEEGGNVEKVQLDAIRIALEEDFLLELFTLRRGAFAFFKESFPIQGLEERFELCIEFDADQVLLEIARRSDEWSQILDALGDLDEVYIATGANESIQDNSLEADVLEQIDGKRSIRDVAGGMLDTLFEATKAAANLVRAGAIALAPTHHLLGVARNAIDGNSPRQAIDFLGLLRARRLPSIEEREEVANLYVQAEDPRTAATVLADAAADIPDAERRLDVLTYARSLDGLNVAVLEELVGSLRMLHGVGSPLFDEAATRLSEIYLDNDEYDKALEIVEELEVSKPSDLQILSRKARILQKSGRQDDALNVLEELKEEFSSKGETEKQTKALEQILKLDPRNAKARAELKTLVESKTMRRVKRLAFVMVGLLILRFSWTLWDAYQAGAAARIDIAEASKLLDEGKLDDAKILADKVLVSVENDELKTQARQLAWKIDKQISERDANARDLAQRRLQADIRGAVQLLEGDKFVEGLDVYAKLLDRYEGTKQKLRVEGSLKTRLVAISQQLLDEIQSFESNAASRPTELDTPEQRLAHYERCQKFFADGRIAGAKALNDRILAKKIPVKIKLPQRLTDATKRFIERATPIADLRTRLAKEIKNDRRKRALNETFVKAKKAEEAHDFASAKQYYEALAKGYEGEQSTARLFAQKAAFFTSVVEELGKLEAATKRGDFESAKNTLELMRGAAPEIPFDELVELPLTVTTSPPGATVLRGDKAIGKTPLIVPFNPNKLLGLEVRLEGFEPVRVDESARSYGSFYRALELMPLASAEVGAAITQPAVYSHEHRAAVLTDRKGHVIVRKIPSLDVVWSKKIDDGSGKIGSPAIHGSQCLLSTRGGQVICLDMRNGDTLWTVRPAERLLSPAARVGNRVFVTSDDGHVYELGRGGRVTQSFRVADALRFSVQADGPQLLSLDTEGVARAHNLDGQEIWSKAIPSAGWIAPRLAEGSFVVAGANRKLHTLRASNGEIVWSTPTKATIDSINVARGRVWVLASKRWIYGFDRKSGEPLRTIELQEPVRALVVESTEGLVVLRAKAGAVVIDPDTGRVASRLARGLKSELPMMLAGPDHLLFMGVDGKLVTYDRRLIRKR